MCLIRFVSFLKLFFSSLDIPLTNLFYGIFGEKSHLGSNLRMYTLSYLIPVLFWTRSVTCLLFHPILLSDSSCLISPLTSFDTVDGFPLLGLSLRSSSLHHCIFCTIYKPTILLGMLCCIIMKSVFS